MNALNMLQRVAVYLKGDFLIPEEVTAQMGVEPTQSHRKGHAWRTITDREVIERTGLWSLSIDARSRALPELLSELVAALNKAGVSPRQIIGVEDAYIDVFIAADADDAGGGTCEFELDENCLLAAAKLRLPLCFTVAVVRD